MFPDPYVPQYLCSPIRMFPGTYLPRVFLSPRGVQGRSLMDSHPYSYETFIFTLGASHEVVQGRQTKLHPGVTLGKLVQPSPGISINRDSLIVLSKRS